MGVVAQQQFEPVWEGWQRGLAVVAHPDDLEYGTAAAVARWTAQGKQVSYALLTSGEAGIDGMTPEQAGPAREAEQRSAAALVGVRDVEFLGFADGMLEYGLALRRALAAAVRRHRPEVVITTNFRDIWGEAEGRAMLNQADHVATGRALLDAVRDAGNRWVFRVLVDEGLEPWAGVKQVWAAHSPGARHAVDVTDTFDQGVESLRAHEVYLRGLGPDAPDPAEFLDALARQAGTRLGVRQAVPLEVFHFDLW